MAERWQFDNIQSNVNVLKSSLVTVLIALRHNFGMIVTKRQARSIRIQQKI